MGKGMPQEVMLNLKPALCSMQSRFKWCWVWIQVPPSLFSAQQVLWIAFLFAFCF